MKAYFCIVCEFDLINIKNLKKTGLTVGQRKQADIRL